MDELENDRLIRLSAFSAKLLEKRKAAVDGRKNSGVEIRWREDDEYYDGIDDANRAEMMLKPATTDGRVIMSGRNEHTNRSTVFVNITQPYVDMASARVSDMLLPTEDKPFSLNPTPIPEINDVMESEEVMPDGQSTVGDAAKSFMAEAVKSAELAEDQLWDWFVESGWHSEVRKLIEQTARIGCSVLKGPFPAKKKKRQVNKQDDGTIALMITEEIKPAIKWVDSWNFYPDPACGENIHNGAYCFESDFLNAKQLLELKGTGYIDSQIDEVIKEGPDKCNVDSKGRTVDTDTFKIWYYTGFANAEELESAGCECGPGAMMPVVVTMVNDRIIKASISILDSGKFPYDVMVWQRRANTWTGTGVARQVRTPQRMIIAASRNLMDNAGVSAGPQIVVKQGILEPADGEWSITPLKLWLIDENADIAQASHAISSIVIPTLQAELKNIIDMGLDFAERATSMPLLLQGQQGASTETVGGMQILQANASTVLKRIAKICDDAITVPKVEKFYEWLMTYSDNEEAKGDYCIVAHGASSFYERDAQNQMIMQLLPMSADPEFLLSKDRLMQEVLKMNKITPDRVRLTDEEISALRQQQQQAQPTDPAIELQKMKSETAMQIEQLKQQSDMAELERRAQSAESEMALKIQMMQQEHEFDLQLKQIDMEIEAMRLASAQNISLESIKAQLAQNVQRLNTQKELSLMNHAVKQVAEPPVEPVQHAPDNQAFQQ